MEYFTCSEEAILHLKKKDRKLGAAIDRMGDIRREVTPDLFTALVGSIIAQQIASKAAETVTARLQARAKGLAPETLANMEESDIQQCGMSMRKAGYIRGAAEAVCSRMLDLSKFEAMTDEDIIKTLSSLNGIGVWTAEMLLIFSLRRPDVVSWGDFAIRKGMMRLYGLKELKKEQFVRYRKRYSPFGSTASLYLWALSAEQD